MNNSQKIMLALLSCLTIGQAVASFTFKPYKNTLATIDINGVETQDFYVINKQTLKAISLPTSGKAIIALTPTEGLYTNRPVKVLFYALDLTQPLPTNAPANMIAAAKKTLANQEIGTDAKTLVGIYRQLPDEPKWTSLTEVPTVDTLADLAAEESIRLILNGRGQIIATLPAYQKALKDNMNTRIGAAQIKFDPTKSFGTILP